MAVVGTEPLNSCCVLCCDDCGNCTGSRREKKRKRVDMTSDVRDKLTTKFSLEFTSKPDLCKVGLRVLSKDTGERRPHLVLSPAALRMEGRLRY